MDIIQLVFGFVNAPLFATFLLGMFWKRATGTGAFLGLFGGIACSALFHALTSVSSNLDAAGHVINSMKGGYIQVLHAVPQRNGAELLARFLRFHRLLRVHPGHFPRDQPHQE